MDTKRNLAALLGVVLILVISACSSTTLEPVIKKSVDLTFGSHLAAGFPEQDVFIEVPAGSGQVRRMIMHDGETYLDAPVYASRQLIPHDPFQLMENPIGPYTRGEKLGFTMREWLAGTGSGSYTRTGRTAEIDLRFEKLIPNAVYTVWCASISVRTDIRTLAVPCGSPDGSDNRFTTDNTGRGRFYLTVTSLPDTALDTAWAIAVVYHGNGKTYGAYPGDFGKDSHTQLLAFIPNPGDAAWQAATAESNAIVRQ